nr:hypothetical protein [Tanacetum cinerariifolium]
EERHIEKEEEDELYKHVNINQGRGIQASLEVEDSHVTLTPVNPDGMESIFETTSQLDVPTPTSVDPLPITTPTMTSSTISTTTTTTSQAPILPTTVSSDIIQNLPNFGLLFRFDDRLRSLEENFSEFRQTNQFAEAVSSILGIVNHYMDQRMNEAVKVSIQIQSDRLRDETQRENDEFLRTVDENIKKIIKEQVKEQVKVQVSKILPRIEQAVNEQLEAEVLTRSSHSSRTSYVVAADLSEMELKKILIEKMEGNKSIQRSDEQRNLYKALVEAYEFDQIILDTYGETVTLKRRRDDDADKDEEPSAGPDRGSKRRREGKEPESTSAPIETVTRSAGRSTQGSKTRQASVSESALAEEPMQTTSQIEEPSHLEFDAGADDQPIVQSSQHPECELAKQADSRSSFNKLMDTPLDFSNFLMNRLRVDTLTPELLAGPTYKLMKGSCISLIELEYHMEEVYKATTDQLDWVNPEGQHDGTLTGVRTALDDRLKGIWMRYPMLQNKISLTYAGNPVKEILLKFNLSDHRSILTDLQVTPTNPGRMTKPYSSHRLIANCFNAGNSKIEVKVQGTLDYGRWRVRYMVANQQYELCEAVGSKLTKNGAHNGYNCPSQFPFIQTFPGFPQQRNLIPSPSEFEDLSHSECDVPTCDDFTTFSNLLIDADDDFSSSDDESFSDEDISKKIYSNPLFDEEIIFMDPHHFNTESDLIGSLLNHDSLIISSSSKIDSLLDEFTGELILLMTIPSRIDETDCDPEEEIHHIEKLLYDNSSPCPLEEFIFENSDAAIESFSPFPINVEDNDSIMEEIDLSFTPDDPMLSDIEEDDYDPKRDMLIFE